MFSTLFQPKKPTQKQLVVMLLICMIGSLLCMGLMWKKSEAENPYYADSRQYISGAYNLYHHQTYSQYVRGEVATPRIGREPGWPFLISMVGHFDEGFQSLNVDCLTKQTCSKETASTLQWVNRGLFAGAGVLMFISGYIVTGRLGGAVVAGGALWLNKHMQKNMDYVVSDPLALFLTSLFILCMALAFLRKTHRWWAFAGLSLAALALTKSIYYYFGLLFLVGWIGFIVLSLIKDRESIRALSIKFVLFSVLFMAPLLGWMERNHQVSGDFRLTDDRSGIVLNTREILNHMTLGQYFTSFLYWTRGFGDNWARDLLPKEIWDEFQIDNPQGFYLKAQLGYTPRVIAKMQELNLSKIEAQKNVDHDLMSAIITNPVVHVFVTLPVMYRGIWVDQYAWFSVPALIWMLVLCWKYREQRLFILLTSGLFNISFYALVSLNIPRYQMTAGPTLALALAVAYVILSERGVFARLKQKVLRR